MIFCAPIVSPDSTSRVIIFFWPSVNWTPARDSADMPLIGSLSALPTSSAEDFMSLPSATDISSVALVAWLKTSLPLPASLRILRKVSSTFSPDAISSSSTPLLVINDSASSDTCLAVTLAAPPVDLITASVWAATFCCSANSSIPILTDATSAAKPAAPAATAAVLPRSFSLEPRPPVAPEAEAAPACSLFVSATNSTTTWGLATSGPSFAPYVRPAAPRAAPGSPPAPSPRTPRGAARLPGAGSCSRTGRS